MSIWVFLAVLGVSAALVYLGLNLVEPVIRRVLLDHPRLLGITGLVYHLAAALVFACGLVFAIAVLVGWLV